MKICLLRWNPAVSSWKDDDFRRTLSELKNGPVGMDWSVREWSEVESGDWAVLCRVGTLDDGIVGIGRFDGSVKEAPSWRGDGTTCHYAAFRFDILQDPSRTRLLTADDLASAFPRIEWHGGHSGVSVPGDLAPALARCLADALEKAPAAPDDDFSAAPGPGEVARALRLAFCPESMLGGFRRLLPGQHVTLHRAGDPDGEEPASGDFRIVVANPHGGESIRIDLGGEPTLFFACHHVHYFPDDDEWQDLLDTVRDIVAGKLAAHGAFSGGKCRWSSFESDLPASPASAYLGLVAACAKESNGGVLRHFAREGATIEWVFWNPGSNRRFELSPEWFRSIARPTGLDALLAYRGPVELPGFWGIKSFEFTAAGSCFACACEGGAWVAAETPWIHGEDLPPPIRATSLDALLDAPVSASGAGETLRDVLSGIHAFDVSVRRAPFPAPEEEEEILPEEPDSVPWSHCFAEMPLDLPGLYGMAVPSAHVASHVLHVPLTFEDSGALAPAIRKMNDRIGIEPNFICEEIVPSHCVAEALAVLRECHAATPILATGKLLPLFETAASAGMPVRIRL